MNHPLVTYSKGVSIGTVLLLGFASLHFSWLLLRWGEDTQQLLLGNALYIVPTLVSGLVILAAALRRTGRVRRGWLLIGFGITAQFVGNSIWGYLELVSGTEPFPSLGDLFYLLFGPLVIAGLLQLMPTPRSRRDALRLGLDVAITVGALGLYFWRFLLAPPLTWNEAMLPTLVTLAYPVLDLLLLSLVLLLMMREWRGEVFQPEFVLMGFGLAAQIGADVLFSAALARGEYYSGHPLDALWTLSAVFFALAARASLIQGRYVIGRGVPALNSQLTVLMPYVAVALAFGLLIVTETNPALNDAPEGKGVLYGVVFVTALVVLRQLLAFDENRRLAQDLSRQSAELKLLSETLEHKVQERTAELEALSRRFRYDTLTGLPNRAHFQKRLQEVAARERPFAVLYLDFDRFKAINDSFGHAVGDAFLVAVGKRLESCLRPGDLVARLGGDEFAMLLENTGLLANTGDAAGVTQVAERALQALQALQAPVAVEGYTLHATASIGVVVGEGSWGSAENVLRDADIAMYRAKALGRSRFVVFEPAMREHIQARLALEEDLRGAVEREELEVYYQPVVRTVDDSVAGFEALVRWRHPQHGLVSPAAFIPLAEESGVIIAIDRWVLKTACAQLKAWSAVDAGLAIGVNFSSRQFTQADLPPFIAGVLATFGVEPHRLKVELTESLLLDGSVSVRETLAALRDLGVRLHIDDFGTGYSSLSYLQRFDADLLKIDHSFVARMLESKDSAELVRTIVNMAHNLEMKVVAEGVETQAQYARLKAMGCEYAQGYLFSKPLPAAAAAQLLHDKTRPGVTPGDDGHGNEGVSPRQLN